MLLAGKTERWRIVWRDTPKPVCETFSCPCVGFQYGERGDADLIRARKGLADDVLSLSSVFDNVVDQGLDLPNSGVHQAFIRRWPVRDGDHSIADFEALWRDVRTRPTTTIMDLRDYNHDGWAAEFVLPVGGVGCAMHRSVVIGVTRRRPKLHVFTSAAQPNVPLLLSDRAWGALRESRQK